MSKITKNQSGLSIGLKAIYNEEEEKVILLPDDPDLNGKNFKILVREGTDTERTLFDLMRDKNVKPIRNVSTDRVIIPKELITGEGASLDDSNVVIGYNDDGQIFLDLSENPITKIGGPPGSGKTIMCVSIAAQAVNKGYLVCILTNSPTEYKRYPFLSQKPNGTKSSLNSITKPLIVDSKTGGIGFVYNLMENFDVDSEQKVLFICDCSDYLLDSGDNSVRNFRNDSIDELLILKKLEKFAEEPERNFTMIYNLHALNLDSKYNHKDKMTVYTTGKNVGHFVLPKTEVRGSNYYVPKYFD